MEDEVIDQGATPVDEPVQDSVQEQTDEPTESQTESDIETEETETEPPVEDTEEVDYGGKKYVLPKELKDALLRNEDYTRKTQEVAANRKAFEQERETFQRQVQIQQQTLKDHAALMALDEQVKQFDQIDWQKLIDTDPIEAMKLDRQYRSLTDMRQQTATRITEAEKQALEMQRTHAAKLIEQGQQILAKEIKGWSPDLAKSLASYGTTLGFTEQEMGSVLDPRVVKLLHKAHMYDQLAKEKSTPAPKEKVQPAIQVKAKAKAATSPDDMSMEQWIKWRNSQKRK